MQVTKYAQSCVVVETDHARLLIDPGNFVVESGGASQFGRVDGVLYTHRHADHFDARLVEPLAEQGARFVVNADVATLLEGHALTVLEDGEETEVAGARITAHDLPHCEMVDGSPGPPNTGYVIDGSLLHPGDAVDAPLRVDLLAVPIAGPSVSFRDAYRFVDHTGAAKVVPIHYDAFIADPQRFARSCDLAEIIVLGHGESATL